jgi:hypothetical protein
VEINRKEMADHTGKSNLDELRRCVRIMKARITIGLMSEAASQMLSPNMPREIAALIEIVKTLQALDEGQQSSQVSAGTVPFKQQKPHPLDHVIDDLDGVDRNLIRAAAQKVIDIIEQEVEIGKSKAIELESRSGGEGPENREVVPRPPGQNES